MRGEEIGVIGRTHGSGLRSETGSREGYSGWRGTAGGGVQRRLFRFVCPFIRSSNTLSLIKLPPGVCRLDSGVRGVGAAIVWGVGNCSFPAKAPLWRGWPGPGLCIRIAKRVSSGQGVPATVGSSPVCQDHAGFEGLRGEPWQPAWRWKRVGPYSVSAQGAQGLGRPGGGEGVSESFTEKEAFK